MKIRDLLEEFYGYAKKYGRTHEIFKNPSSKEIREVLGKNSTVRFFVVDADKAVYIFKAFDVTHFDIASTLNPDWYVLEKNGKGFSGIATYNNGKLVATSSDGLEAAVKKGYYKEIIKIIRNPRMWNKTLDCKNLFSLIKTKMKEKDSEDWDED